MKYRNTKTEIDGIKFDSKKEAERYRLLKHWQDSKVICDLQTQVKYQLIPNQYIDGELVERAVKYIADFVYRHYGIIVVEDVKGMKTRDYIIKRKLMLDKYNIRIKEI
jgi:hypothetical protein